MTCSEDDAGMYGEQDIRKINMQGTANVHNDGVGRADLI
jgi:hypothetical protein